MSGNNYSKYSLLSIPVDHHHYHQQQQQQNNKKLAIEQYSGTLQRILYRYNLFLQVHL